MKYLSVALAALILALPFQAQAQTNDPTGDKQMSLCELVIGMLVIGAGTGAIIMVLTACRRCCTHELVLYRKAPPDMLWEPIATNYINPCVWTGTNTNYFILFEGIMMTNIWCMYKVQDNGCVTNAPSPFAVRLTQ